VLQELLAQQVLRVNREKLGLQAKLVRKVRKVRRVFRGKMVPKDQKATQELLDHRVRSV
jgi:hypothetical protein